MKKFKFNINWNAIISGLFNGAAVFAACEWVNLEFGLVVAIFVIISTRKS